jgi:hypothetical protein
LETNKSEGTSTDDFKLASEENCFEFFKENTKTIEIMFKDDNVYKVYFPLEPVCMHLSNAS